MMVKAGPQGNMFRKGQAQSIMAQNEMKRLSKGGQSPVGTGGRLALPNRQLNRNEKRGKQGGKKKKGRFTEVADDRLSYKISRESHVSLVAVGWRKSTKIQL